MPPEGKPLTPDEIDDAAGSGSPQGAKWEKHWAFVPPQRHDAAGGRATRRGCAIRSTRSSSRGSKQAGLDARAAGRQAARSPAAPISTSPACRRPSEQLDAFLADDAPDAWPRLVDALLASPHYGEHWARHWLDLVRFAETNSFERDGLKPNAWKYRDYVIRSFNDDKPYDQFLREQLAGDELDEVTDESIIATGYYRLGIWDDEPADPLQARYDEFDDIISTTSQAMLGLTVGCARCHDHKIDPIPQADYYGLLAFFADVTPYGDIRERDPARYSQWDMSPPEERAQRARAARASTTRSAKRCTAMEEVGIERMTRRRPAT